MATCRSKRGFAAEALALSSERQRHFLFEQANCLGSTLLH